MALLGAGHWGAKLARCIADIPDTELRWVYDTDATAADPVAAAAGVRLASSLDEIFNDDEVQAVVIATPASAHADLATACLQAGRHVLVEKPLASLLSAAGEVARVAVDRGLVLMVDHTYLFTAAAEQARSILAAGQLGKIEKIESLRSNTDASRFDVDVFWDLAHHDLSILGYVFADLTPATVSAVGRDELGIGHASTGTMTVQFANGFTLSAHLQWVGHEKLRRMHLFGSHSELIWDDLAGDRRLSLRNDGTTTVIPLAAHEEPLRGLVREFAAAIAGTVRPRCDAGSEMRVLAVLDAAGRSLELDGAPVSLDAVPTR